MPTMRFRRNLAPSTCPTQTQAEITAAAELKAEIIAKEVEVGSLEKFVTKTHSSYLQAKIQLDELRNKYDEFKYGPKMDGSKSGSNSDLFLPFEDIPDIGLKYARNFREMMLQEKLLEFMLPQYEQAKIQEARDMPTMMIIDPAVRPERKTHPKRMLIVLFAGFLSILFFVIAVYFAVNLNHLRQTNVERYQQVSTILSQLKPGNWFK